MGRAPPPSPFPTQIFVFYLAIYGYYTWMELEDSTYYKYDRYQYFATMKPAWIQVRRGGGVSGMVTFLTAPDSPDWAPRQRHRDAGRGAADVNDPSAYEQHDGYDPQLAGTDVYQGPR